MFPGSKGGKPDKNTQAQQTSLTSLASGWGGGETGREAGGRKVGRKAGRKRSGERAGDREREADRQRPPQVGDKSSVHQQGPSNHEAFFFFFFAFGMTVVWSSFSLAA